MSGLVGRSTASGDFFATGGAGAEDAGAPLDAPASAPRADDGDADVVDVGVGVRGVTPGVDVVVEASVEGRVDDVGTPPAQDMTAKERMTKRRQDAFTLAVWAPPMIVVDHTR